MVTDFFEEDGHGNWAYRPPIVKCKGPFFDTRIERALQRECVDFPSFATRKRVRISFNAFTCVLCCVLSTRGCALCLCSLTACVVWAASTRELREAVAARRKLRFPSYFSSRVPRAHGLRIYTWSSLYWHKNQ